MIAIRGVRSAFSTETVAICCILHHFAFLATLAQPATIAPGPESAKIEVTEEIMAKMTVSELKNQLSKLPADAKVVVGWGKRKYTNERRRIIRDRQSFSS